ncbi:MAG: hypothetical protein AAF530_02465 [Pseudomonadota bacterium]
MDLASIETLAGSVGLALRGGFHPRADDGVPPLPSGPPAQTVVLLGNVGSSIWPQFSHSTEALDGQPDPLNRWSTRVIGEMAEALGGVPHYPFGGPPYVPFLRWAQRAEPVFSSPLGMLIHPVYGVWHAYRGALAFAETIQLPLAREADSPCESCRDRPCLSACPVSAFGQGPYRADDCAAHIATPAGVDCLEQGCLARRACPIGADFLYLADQAGLHMKAFLTARQKDQQERRTGYVDS